MKPTFPILKVVATIYASREHQNKLAQQLNPGYDISGAKPSEKVYISVPAPKGPYTDGTADSVYLPSLTSYTKMTFGLDEKWLDAGSEAITVTDKHYEDAQAGIDTIQNKLMMMVLKGIKVNGFISALAKLLEKEEVLERDIGLLTYVPKTAAQYNATDEIDNKKTAFMNSKPVGRVDQKVELEVTIFNSRVMTQYESILYEGHDENGNLITFFKNEGSKGQFDVDGIYKITGKVKNVGATPYSYGAIVNTLNYVRMMK